MIANSMVMTFYPWNMTAAVLAAVILLPTGIAPQSEELSGAWWLWRLGWIAACAICLVPFLFAFRWAERPGAPPPSGPAGWSGLVLSLAGVACASAWMSIIAAVAFPVQGEVLAMPLLGMACLVVGAILLHVNPFSPLSNRSAESLRGWRRRRTSTPRWRTSPAPPSSSATPNDRSPSPATARCAARRRARFGPSREGWRAPRSIQHDGYSSQRGRLR